MGKCLLELDGVGRHSFCGKMIVIDERLGDDENRDGSFDRPYRSYQRAEKDIEAGANDVVIFMPCGD